MPCCERAPTRVLSRPRHILMRVSSIAATSVSSNPSRLDETPYLAIEPSQERRNTTRRNKSVGTEYASIRAARTSAGAGRARRARWPTFLRRVSTLLRPGQSRGAKRWGRSVPPLSSRHRPYATKGGIGGMSTCRVLTSPTPNYPARQVHRLVHHGRTLEGPSYAIFKLRPERQLLQMHG
jgi:hypothetical protein